MAFSSTPISIELQVGPQSRWPRFTCGICQAPGLDPPPARSASASIRWGCAYGIEPYLRKSCRVPADQGWRNGFKALPVATDAWFTMPRIGGAGACLCAAAVSYMRALESAGVALKIHRHDLRRLSADAIILTMQIRALRCVARIEQSCA